MSPAAAKKEDNKEVKMKATKTTKKSNDGGKVLVIVESPAKSKTIKKILGANYQIEADKVLNISPNSISFSYYVFT